MTKEQLKKDDIRGQQASEAVHTKVGETVREIVKSHAGRPPEDLPQEKLLISEVKKDIKKLHRGMKRNKS